jgi:hypothetical protein
LAGSSARTPATNTNAASNTDSLLIDFNIRITPSRTGETENELISSTQHTGIGRAAPGRYFTRVRR